MNNKKARTGTQQKKTREENIVIFEAIKKKLFVNRKKEGEKKKSY